MIETIEELNNSIDSLKLISKHTLKNGKFYVLYYGALPEDFDESMWIGERMISSFQFI